MSSTLNRPTRVAWILNHTTLMEFEADLLQRFGCEVFVPKVLPQGLDSRTAAVTREYDQSLSIPKEDLEILNAADLYSRPPTQQVKGLLNKHFDVLFVPYVFPGFYYLVRAFKGKIVIRAFGHCGEHNYQSATSHVGDLDYYLDTPSLIDRMLRKSRDWSAKLRGRNELASRTPVMLALYQAKDRVFFGSAYESVIAYEPEFFRSRSVFIPLAVPPSITKHTDTHIGGNGKIFFVCPNINDLWLYRSYYDTFKKHFGDLPHVIGGRQNMTGGHISPPITDSAILGYQTRDQFDKTMREAECLFYHSREPRHIHYHPIEAMVFGTPVVYMADGMLEELGGPDQPGLCHSYDEAHLKMERLLQGDKRLAQSIRQRQKEIVYKFSDKYCYDTWQRTFVGKVIPSAKPLTRLAA